VISAAKDAIRSIRVMTVLQIALGTLVAAADLRADVVELRNGGRIEGRVRVLDDKIEVVMPDGRTVTLRRAEVADIRTTGDERPRDVRISAALRRRVERHQRLKAYGEMLRTGGPGALQAARELVRAGPAGLPHLEAALKAKDDATVGLAIRALGSVRARPATAALAERLPTLELQLQVLALGCLGQLRAVHARPAVSALLRAAGTPPAVQKAAVRTLGRLRTDLAVPPLVRALERPVTSGEAADALRALGAPEALPYLDRLVEKGAASRRAAAEIASQIARPEHVPLLLRFREHDAAAVQRAGRAGLERLKEGRADRVGAYVALLSSVDKAERRAAAAQLAKLTGRDAGNAKAWRRWWLDQNRGRARIALVPLGPADKAARIVAGAVGDATGVQVAVAPAQPLSRWSRAAASTRFRSDALLDQLDDRLRENEHAIIAIGLTTVAVEQPDRGTVMGGWRHGRSGLVSLPALDAGDADSLRRRLRRYTLHVLARALRIARSDDDACPAGAVFEPVRLDGLSDSYSKHTAELIAHSVNGSVAELAGFPQMAWKELRALDKVAPPFEHALERARLAERAVDLAGARQQWAAALRAAPDAAAKAACQARIDLIDALADPK
jgi:HEAT repeat protein